MRLNVFNSLIGLCVATAAVSCSDGLVEDNLRPVGGESDMISFVVANENNATRGGSLGNRPCGGAILRSSDGADSLFLNVEVADIADDPATRALDITNDKNAILNMTCIIRSKGESGDFNYTDYFKNENFKKNGEVWASNPPHFWLNNENAHFSFYGYYCPENSKAATYLRGTDNSQDAPSVFYDLKEEQFDLTYYKSPEYIGTDFNKILPIELKHALSKITFKTGSLSGGTITSVTVNNVYHKGTFNLGTENWSVVNNSDSISNFEISDVNISGDDVKFDDYGKYLMLLPGSSIKGKTEVVVKFKPKGSGEKEEPKEYVGTLPEIDWERGKGYTYTISIDPEVGIVIEDLPEYVDAHYVIAKAHVNVEQLPEGKNWELKVSADYIYDEDVSVVGQLSEYQKDGFWIDEIITSPTATSGTSARGTKTLTGTSSQDVYIFIPEHVKGSENRTITLSLNIQGSTAAPVDVKSFEQYLPAWVGDYGWEQTDDNKSGQFGFNWNRVVYYGYLYSYAYNIFTGASRDKDRYSSYLNSIITTNNATNYASLVEYDSGYPLKPHRLAIKIDYKSLNDLGGNDHNDGLKNSRTLYTKAGTSTTGEFENVVASILKTEEGETNNVAFRKGNGKSGEAPDEDGVNSPNVPAIGECLKKNRYFLLEIKSEDDDIGYTPIIKDVDIKWYLPAVNQFNNIPTGIKDGINKSVCWSSTTSASDQTQAYTGDGNLYPRLNQRKIRACRNKE